MTRPLSPAQIRTRARLAFQQRQRADIAARIRPLRHAAPVETPLSAAEIAFGLARGLIAGAQP